VSREPLTPLLWRFSNAGRPGGTTFVLAPFAGGSAYSLADLSARLARPGDHTLVLQYPGRGPRMAEAHARDLTQVAREAALDLSRHVRGPLVLAGHSMGGVLCYEIASWLAAVGRAPAWVVVSAARPPVRRHGRRTASDWTRRASCPWTAGTGSPRSPGAPPSDLRPRSGTGRALVPAGACRRPASATYGTATDTCDCTVGDVQTSTTLTSKEIRCPLSPIDWSP